MKLRNLFIILTVTFSGLAFSACTDESEEVVPQPINTEETATTVVTGGETQDPMD